MTVLRWDPWGEMAALQRDVSQLLGRGAVERSTALVPPIDVHRTDEGLVVHVELPGLRAEDVDLTVEDGMLTISGERRRAADVDEDSWVRRERAVGTFARSFTLPEGTDPDAIEAAFAHGVLELRVPHPPARQPRRIRIASGEQDETIQLGEGGASRDAEAGDREPSMT
jgi:HSP20 family protein